MRKWISLFVVLCMVFSICALTAYAEAPADAPAMEGESAEGDSENGESAADAGAGDSAEDAAPAEGESAADAGAGDSAEDAAPAEGESAADAGAGDSAVDAAAAGGESAGGESSGDSTGSTTETDTVITVLEPVTMDELIIGPEGYEFTTDVYTGKLEIDPSAEITSTYPVLCFFEESESVENGAVIGGVQFVSDYDEVAAIIHTNDVHGHLDVEPYVKGLADEMKASGDYSLVLTVSGGDIYGGGEAVAGSYRGEFIPQIVDLIYDVIVPGNNDYTINGDASQNLLLTSLYNNTQTLNANAATYEDGLAMGDYASAYEASIGNELFAEIYDKVALNDDGSLDMSGTGLVNIEEGGIRPYDYKTTFTTANGTVIGIFGVTDNGGAIERGLQSTGTIVNAQESVDELLADGATVIVGIGHTGWLGEEATAVSVNDTNSWQVANQVSNLDVFVDAHTHSIIGEGQGCLVGDDPTMVNQAESFGTCIGVMYLYLKDGKVVAVDANVINDMEGITPDADIQALVDRDLAKVKEDFGKPIAYTEYFLNAERMSANNDGGSVRANETNLGDLMTDVIRDACSEQMGVDYDFCAYFGYWLRASIEPGDITLESIQSVFANPTVLYYETYTGQDVLDMVNRGLSTVYPEGEGQAFLQYSGVEVTYTYNAGGTGTPVTIKIGDTLVYDAANGGLQVAEDWTCEGILNLTGGEIDSYTGDMANWICSDKEQVQQLVGDWFQNHTEDDYTIYPNTIAPGGRVVEVEG